MRKFSNVSGSIVGIEPNPVELTKEDVEIISFKNEVMKLMDNLLSIRSYGVARPEIMMPTKIVGKEMFVEALTNLLANKSNREQVKALESLKSTNRDWVSIDRKIDSIEDMSVNVKESRKIYDIIKKYGSTEEDLKFYLESYVKKITKDQAYDKYRLIEKMITKSSDPMLVVISRYLIDYTNETS